MADKSAREFGTRRPAAIPAAPPVKRSRHVALLVMGAFAVGGGAYALMPRENCAPNQPGMAAPPGLQTGAECRSRGSSGGGSHIGSRSSFFSSDDSSNHSASGTSSSDSGTSHVTRGGFGAFTHAFTSHFSGGG